MSNYQKIALWGLLTTSVVVGGIIVRRIWRRRHNQEESKEGEKKITSGSDNLSVASNELQVRSANIKHASNTEIANTRKEINEETEEVEESIESQTQNEQGFLVVSLGWIVIFLCIFLMWVVFSSSLMAQQDPSIREVVVDFTSVAPYCWLAIGLSTGTLTASALKSNQSSTGSCADDERKEESKDDN